jgi:hypothetical protein
MEYNKLGEHNTTALGAADVPILPAFLQLKKNQVKNKNKKGSSNESIPH